MIDQIKEWAKKSLQGDSGIWLVVILLSAFSIVVVYSATGILAYRMMNGNTEYYLIKHTALVLVSFFAIWMAHRLDFRYYSKLSRLLVLMSVPLLIFTWLYGTNINEASRWITIPYINQAFQPSDIAKLALIITLASILSKRQNSIHDFQRTIVPMLFWVGLICGLIALTNISSAVLLFLICMMLMFVGRVPVKYLAILMLFGVLFGSVALMIGQRGNTATSRIEDFVSGDIPYQAKQAYVAIASGWPWGKGLGQSDQRNFLPYPYSDYIYAIIIEEYGMIGGVVVLAAYIFLLFRGMRIAERSEYAYGTLLATGLSISIVFQALINMAVVVGLAPVTGITLPFLSMGGTSQLFAGISLGIILSVSRGSIDSPKKYVRNQYKELT